MRKFWLDLAERTAATYVVALLGLLLADGVDLASIGTLRSAAVAAIPAGLTVLKGAIASLIGDPSSAALLPVSKPQAGDAYGG